MNLVDDCFSYLFGGLGIDSFQKRLSSYPNEHIPSEYLPVFMKLRELDDDANIQILSILLEHAESEGCLDAVFKLSMSDGAVLFRLMLSSTPQASVIRRYFRRLEEALSFLLPRHEDDWIELYHLLQSDVSGQMFAKLFDEFIYAVSAKKIPVEAIKMRLCQAHPMVEMWLTSLDDALLNQHLYPGNVGSLFLLTDEQNEHVCDWIFLTNNFFKITLVLLCLEATTEVWWSQVQSPVRLLIAEGDDESLNTYLSAVNVTLSESRLGSFYKNLIYNTDRKGFFNALSHAFRSNGGLTSVTLMHHISHARQQNWITLAVYRDFILNHPRVSFGFHYIHEALRSPSPENTRAYLCTLLEAVIRCDVTLEEVKSQLNSCNKAGYSAMFQAVSNDHRENAYLFLYVYQALFSVLEYRDALKKKHHVKAVWCEKTSLKMRPHQYEINQFIHDERVRLKNAPQTTTGFSVPCDLEGFLMPVKKLITQITSPVYKHFDGGYSFFSFEHSVFEDAERPISFYPK